MLVRISNVRYLELPSLDEKFNALLDLVKCVGIKVLKLLFFFSFFYLFQSFSIFFSIFFFSILCLFLTTLSKKKKSTDNLRQAMFLPAILDIFSKHDEKLTLIFEKYARADTETGKKKNQHFLFLFFFFLVILQIHSSPRSNNKFKRICHVTS